MFYKDLCMLENILFMHAIKFVLIIKSIFKCRTVHNIHTVKYNFIGRHK